MSGSPQKHRLELGVEFLTGFVLFLYPYGAEQMGLPHNFWLGLSFWIGATVIATRMFWIIPLWADRLSRLQKGLVALILWAALIFVSYTPVLTAYRNSNLPESDIEIKAVKFGPLAPGQPIIGAVDFYNASNHTLKFCSLRRLTMIPPDLPRNEATWPWYFNKKWNDWTRNLTKKDCIEQEIGAKETAHETINHQAKFVLSPEMIAQAKVLNIPITVIAMGFFQYSDGTHQTDYCVVYQGNPNEVLTCNTHDGPSKPTPLP